MWIPVTFVPGRARLARSSTGIDATVTIGISLVAAAIGAKAVRLLTTMRRGRLATILLARSR
jgi:hypothetical protein